MCLESSCAQQVSTPVTVSKFKAAMGGVFASVGLQGRGHRFDVMPSRESPHGQVSDKNNGVQLPVGFGSDCNALLVGFQSRLSAVWVSALSSTLENMDASALSSTVPTQFPLAQSPIFWTLLLGVLVPQLFPSLAQEFGSPSASESIELASPLINFCQALPTHQFLPSYSLICSAQPCTFGTQKFKSAISLATNFNSNSGFAHPHRSRAPKNNFPPLPL